MCIAFAVACSIPTWVASVGHCVYIASWSVTIEFTTNPCGDFIDLWTGTTEHMMVGNRCTISLPNPMPSCFWSQVFVEKNFREGKITLKFIGV